MRGVAGCPVEIAEVTASAWRNRIGPRELEGSRPVKRAACASFGVETEPVGISTTQEESFLPAWLGLLSVRGSMGKIPRQSLPSLFIFGGVHEGS